MIGTGNRWSQGFYPPHSGVNNMGIIYPVRTQSQRIGNKGSKHHGRGVIVHSESPGKYLSIYIQIEGRDRFVNASHTVMYLFIETSVQRVYNALLQGKENRFIHQDASVAILIGNVLLRAEQGVHIMAECIESAESKQKLNDLKGRMLALKEHL